MALNSGGSIVSLTDRVSVSLQHMASGVTLAIDFQSTDKGSHGLEKKSLVLDCFGPEVTHTTINEVSWHGPTLRKVG